MFKNKSSGFSFKEVDSKFRDQIFFIKVEVVKILTTTFISEIITCK